MMANPTVFNYSHQQADSRKFNSVLTAHRCSTQGFVFAAASSLVMNCQSQQLGIHDLIMAQNCIFPHQSVSFNKTEAGQTSEPEEQAAALAGAKSKPENVQEDFVTKTHETSRLRILIQRPGRLA